ncbi:exonuclease [TM7 phage DolZOral124_53_65]|nr:exonuclease [TM7 phage DolZOral124_53_65]
MRVIQLSQSDDREAWLEERRAKITGTKFDKIAPLRYKRDGTTTPTGFWDLLAEFVSVAPDSNKKSLDRGHEVERNATLEAIRLLGLDIVDVNLDPGMWVSDNEHIALSPDAAQMGDRPTFAIEDKCFDSGKHLRTVFFDLVSKRIDDQGFIAALPPVVFDILPDIPSMYNPINSVPKENRSQAKHYFVVNPHLKVLYFVLHDDRIALPELETYVITINREDIEEEVFIQKYTAEKQLDAIFETLKTLTSGLH